MKSINVFILVIVFVLSNFIAVLDVSAGVDSSNSSSVEIQSFSPNVLLTASDLNHPQHVEPTLAIGSNDELYAGWKEANTPIAGGADVSFSKSTDNGQTWTNPVSMPSNVNDVGGKSDPWLNVYNNTIYFSYLEYWSANSASSFTQVTMAKSSDNGNTWETAKASNNSLFADKEAFTISKNGIIFLVYDDVDFQTSLGVVRLSKSIDGGKTFTDTIQVNDALNSDILGPYPTLSSNQTLFVAWLKVNDSNNFLGDVYYDHSTDQGQHFGVDQDLNPETDYATYKNWRITIPVEHFDLNDRLYILWSEYNTNWKVYLRYSDDFGVHWSDKIPINDISSVDQFQPDMAIDSNNVLHIVWYEQQNSQYRPYYRTVSFGGTNRDSVQYSNIIPVASAFTSDTFVRPGDYCTIRVDSNNIPHVVWTDGRSGSLDIYYSHGTTSKPSGSIAGYTVDLFLCLPLVFIVIRKRNIK